MTTFHSWDEVRGEVFDTEDLEVIAAGAPNCSTVRLRPRGGSAPSALCCCCGGGATRTADLALMQVDQMEQDATVVALITRRC
ncbi:hypothetical protein ACH4TV_26505 [Streptomyces sp. NPDC020898]|uniref:hypothetical protein n=1 Tax=Streptomyces sp. NPDC020898 TaxID=3365101 RepID=UPI0037B484CE